MGANAFARDDDASGCAEKSDSSSSSMGTLLKVLLASDAANDSTDERPVLLFWRAQSLCAPTSSTETTDKDEKT